MTVERILVFVNGCPVRIYRGLKVKHALIACDESLYREALAGRIVIEDDLGFPVGLEGSLQEGSRLYTKKI